MTITHPLDRPSLRIGYVVLALVLGIVHAVLTDDYVQTELLSPTPTRDSGGYAAAGITTVALIVVLGPLGLAAELLIVLPLNFVFAGSGGADGILTAVLALAIALVNVAIVHAWRRRLRRRAALDRVPSVVAFAWAPPVAAPLALRSAPGSAAGGSDAPIEWADLRPDAWKQALGAVLFALAGCAFSILSIVCGFNVATAHGVDYVPPIAETNRELLVNALAWWPALGVAIAGLVVWIRRGRRGMSLLPFAMADLGLQIGFFGLMLLGYS